MQVLLVETTVRTVKKPEFISLISEKPNLYKNFVYHLFDA